MPNKTEKNLPVDQLKPSTTRKYIFIKDYSTKVVAGGIVGVKTITWKAGDVIEASPIKYPPNEKHIPAVKLKLIKEVDVPVNGMQIMVNIPLSVLDEFNDLPDYNVPPKKDETIIKLPITNDKFNTILMTLGVVSVLIILYKATR